MIEILCFFVLGLATLVPWNVVIMTSFFFESRIKNNASNGSVFWLAENYAPVTSSAMQFVNLFCSAAVLWLFLTLRLRKLQNRLDTLLLVSLASCQLVYVGFWCVSWFELAGPIFLTFLAALLPVLIVASSVFTATVFMKIGHFEGDRTGSLITPAVTGSNLAGLISSCMLILARFIAGDEHWLANRFFALAIFITAIALAAVFYIRHTATPQQHQQQQQQQTLLRSTLINKFQKIVRRNILLLTSLWFLYFSTLVCYPNYLRQIHFTDNWFLRLPGTLPHYYSEVVIFLTFNTFTFLGNIFSAMVPWPHCSHTFSQVAALTVFIRGFAFLSLCAMSPVAHAPQSAISFTQFWVGWALLTFLFGAQSTRILSHLMARYINPTHRAIMSLTIACVISLGVTTGCFAFKLI